LPPLKNANIQAGFRALLIYSLIWLIEINYSVKYYYINIIIVQIKV